jgi:hypothetical protein
MQQACYVMTALTVLGQKVLEEVEIEIFVALCLLGEGDEEANKEDDDHEDKECQGVLEGTPEALASSLLAVLGSVLIVLLMPKVGEGYYQQTQHSIKRVERVVDNLQRVDDVVDLFRRGPVFLAAEAGARGGRDESDIDGDEEDGCQQGQGGEDAHDGNGSGAVARRLVDEDEGGSDGEQQGQGGGVGDPDEAGLDERHGRMGRGEDEARVRSGCGAVQWMRCGEGSEGSCWELGRMTWVAGSD